MPWRLFPPCKVIGNFINSVEIADTDKFVFEILNSVNVAKLIHLNLYTFYCINMFVEKN